MTRILVAVAVVLGLASAVEAKPVCAYSPAGMPAWVNCGMLSADASDADVAAALARSRASNFAWVLQLGHHIPATTLAEEVAAPVRARFERLGLWPYVVAVTWGEEWHERCLVGEFADLGLTPWHPSCGPVVEAWLGRQQAQVRAVTGKPVIWITGMVSASRPVPAASDFVGIDLYPVDGQSFASLAPDLLANETATSLPLIIIPRWFQMTGQFQGPGWALMSAPPDPAWMDGYAAILARPRWVAMIGFLGASRPYAELVGLVDLPGTLAAVESSLRSRGIIR